MHPVLKHLLDTDFKDLSGTRIEGQVALSDDLINQGLHDVMTMLRQPAGNQGTEKAAVPKTTAPASSAQLPDPKLLLQKLNVEHLKYRTEVGKTVVEMKMSL